MAELKPYVEGQQIEPIDRRVYTTIEEQAELKAYREFGDLSQLRVLCDNYHELLSRPTEAEIRAKAIDDFYKALEELTKKNWIDHLEYGITWADIDEIAEQLKEE